MSPTRPRAAAVPQSAPAPPATQAPRAALAPVAPRPEPSAVTDRTGQIVAEARQLLETGGRAALTMRAVADRLSIRAPSLYKHLPGKGSLEALVVEAGLFEVGDALHRVVTRPGRRSPVAALLTTYRSYGRRQPNLYRLITAADFPRDELAPGLETWAGEPFYRAAGEPYAAQALWSFAHGALILEIDRRFLDPAGLNRTWAAGTDAFASLVPD